MVVLEENFKESNHYDLIITNHLLVHCLNIDETLNQLKYILNKNGLMIFTDEINVKYHNPFHINFWDEEIFTDILKKDLKNRYFKKLWILLIQLTHLQNIKIIQIFLFIKIKFF